MATLIPMLREAVENPRIAANAAAIGERIRAEDGVSEAVRQLEALEGSAPGAFPSPRP